MDHDLRMRQGKALALGSPGKEEGAHACRHTDTVCAHIAFNILHGIVNCHSRCDRSSRAVDVEMDILLRVLSLQEHKLCHDHAGGHVCHFLSKEDDPVFQKSGINVVGALSTAGLFNDIRY